MSKTILQRLWTSKASSGSTDGLLFMGLPVSRYGNIMPGKILGRGH